MTDIREWPVAHETEKLLINYVAVPVFILKMDDAGRPLYSAVNNSACQMTGKGENEYLGLTAKEVYQGNFGKIGYEKHLSVISSGEAEVYEIHLPLRGKLVHLRTHLKPVMDANGEITQLVGTSEDISAEHKLRESRSQSLSLMRDLEFFVNLAAHDLRSPILKISALTEAIREDFEDLGDGKLKGLDLMEAVAESSLNLIEEVLNRARTLAAPESIETFKLSSLCEEARNLHDPGRQHELLVDDAELFGDRIATQIAIRNLLDNAIKHNAPNLVKVHISASTSNDGFFTVHVSDDGKGIRDPQSLFEPNSRQPTRPSLGMLAVGQLIKARGGTVCADIASTGPGVAVRFTLPGDIVGECQSVSA
ncbi:MAG: PAS domain-containing protein [Granulosicoccus sp.]|nr:PAS domain-containing protein [Granulosicoccus sp.]